MKTRLAMLAALPAMATALFADGIFLVLPANESLINLGFDLMRMKPAGMVEMACYGGTDEVTSLEFFNRDSFKWFPVAQSSWNDGTIPGASKDALVIVGDSPAASDLLEAASWADNIITPSGRNFHEVANAVHTFSPLSRKQWKALGRNYGITLREIPVVSRYDRPRESAEGQTAPAAGETPAAFTSQGRTTIILVEPPEVEVSAVPAATPAPAAPEAPAVEAPAVETPAAPAVPATPVPAVEMAAVPAATLAPAAPEAPAVEAPAVETPAAPAVPATPVPAVEMSAVPAATPAPAAPEARAVEAPAVETPAAPAVPATPVPAVEMAAVPAATLAPAAPEAPAVEAPAVEAPAVETPAVPAVPATPVPAVEMAAVPAATPAPAAPEAPAASDTKLEVARKSFAEALAKAREEAGETSRSGTTALGISEPHVELGVAAESVDAPAGVRSAALPEIPVPATTVKVPELPAIPVLTIEEAK